MAYKESLKHEFHPSIAFNHCAMIVKGGRVLSTGFNRHGWSSLQRGKGAKTLSVHAEVDALLRLKNRDEANGATVYVVRVGARGNLAISEPCTMCKTILAEHCVKRSVFSISPDAFGMIKF